jgi:hypothetical protein
MCLAHCCTLLIPYHVMTRSSSLFLSFTCLSELAMAKKWRMKNFSLPAFCFGTEHHAAMPTIFKVVTGFCLYESTVAWSSCILIYLACHLLQKNISIAGFISLSLHHHPSPCFCLALGPLLIKQRGVKCSPESTWKNTCSFLSIIYSVHKISNSPFKRCKSPRKAVFNDLHLIFMIHMAFYPKCQKWKKKIAIHMAA